MAATRYKETTVATYAFQEGKVIALLRGGSDIRLKRYEKGMQWFSDNWPPDTPWPEGVRRPEPKGEPVAPYTPIYRRTRKSRR